MNKHREKKSISFWLKMFLFILLLFFLLVLIIFQNIARKNLVNQTIANVNATIRIYATEVDNNLRGLESYLYQTFKDSESIVRIETGGDELAMYNAKRDILDKMTAIAAWDDAIDGMIFYAPGEAPAILEMGPGPSYMTRMYLQEQVCRYIEGENPDYRLKGSGYLIVDMEKETYIIRIYKIHISYMAVYLYGSNLLSPLTEGSGEDSIAFIADTDGTIVESTQPIMARIDIKDSGTFVHMDTGSYLQSNYLSENGDFYYGMLTRSTQIEKQSQTLLILIVITFIVMMVFIAFILSLLWRFIAQPMIHLAASMEKVGEGEWDVPACFETYTRENDALLSTFNEMVGEIKNLKLSNYEYQLAVQKAHLQYLQMQVNPHFYLNALNIVYSLAEIQDYELIQKMVLSLVKYSRYMFKDATQLVTLAEELEHVDNYLQIQQMRFSNRIEYVCQVADELMTVLVPPFIIQSFVENSIKYAINFDQHNRLSVTGCKVMIENKKFMRLEIRDNGTGYGEEILEIMKNGIRSEDETKNVGIRNVIGRLELIYGEKASVRLSNDDGAVTTIDIPMIEK